MKQSVNKPEMRDAGRVRKRVFDYDRPKQAFQNDSRFMEFLAGYPNRDGLMIYLYRSEPVIDNGLIGKPDNWIEKIADIDGFSRERVLEKHGGGKFMLKLSDANQSPRDRAVTYIHAQGVDDPEPKLDLRTLVVTDPLNAPYVEKMLARGFLIRDESGRVRLQTVTATAAAAPAAPAAVVNGAGGAEHEAGGFSFAQIPAKVWGVLAERMIDRLLGAPVAAPAPAAPVFNPEIFFDISLRMAEKMMPPAPAPAPVVDPWENYERIQRIVARANPPNPAAAVASAVAASGGPSWLAAMPEIMKAVPSVLGQIGQLVQMRARVPAPAYVQVPAGVQYGPPAPVAIHYGPPVNGGGVPHVPPGPPVSAGANGSDVPRSASGAEYYGGAAVDGASGLDPEMLEMLALFSPLVHEKLARILPGMIEQFSRGGRGAEFGQAVATLEGPQLYRILYGLGPRGLMVLLRNVPAMQAAMLERPADVDAWVLDFLDFDVDGGAGDESAVDESADELAAA